MMLLSILPAISVVLLLVTTLFLLISWGWRTTLVFLAIQYVGVFFLVAEIWPVEMAAVKLVSGWMSAAILGVTSVVAEGRSWQEGPTQNAGGLFRLFVGGLVILLVFSISTGAAEWLPELSAAQLFGALLLLGMGLIRLGLTGHPIQVIISLLVILSGFEIVFASIEQSALIAGLLATVNLALALAGTYLNALNTAETGEDQG
jgi:hypothetical protein